MLKPLRIVLLLGATISMALFPAANSQNRVGVGSHASYIGLAHGGQNGVGHARPARLVFFGDPFAYSDYPPPGPNSVEGAPQVILLQAAPVAPPPERKLEPLLIEWQGDHYARYGGNDAVSAHEARPSDYSEPAPRSVASAQVSRVSHPPAVLVYHDGHREDVRQYAIVGNSIFAKGEYWQDGYWTRTIQLSALDIPATIRANRDIGVNFFLPAGPNEVVARP